MALGMSLPVQWLLSPPAAAALAAEASSASLRGKRLGCSELKPESRVLREGEAGLGHFG